MGIDFTYKTFIYVSALAMVFTIYIATTKMVLNIPFYDAKMILVPEAVFLVVCDPSMNEL
jgi:hypothetical protein